MTGYVRTDEQQDVLASLAHCIICLDEARQSDGAWKWVILSLHSALQGAMICHLSGTDQVGALTTNCVDEWSQWHQRDRQGEIKHKPPRNRVASAPELFGRLGSELNRVEGGCGRIIKITAAHKDSFKKTRSRG